MQSLGSLVSDRKNAEQNLEETMDAADAKQGLDFSKSKKDQKDENGDAEPGDKVLIDLTKFNNKNVNLDIKLKEHYPSRKPANVFTGNSSGKKSIVF